ncbi:HupE/UreJ family protein [Undibacterium sp. Ji67W]|uniref:HupE/UreJ family protein n=1 Tax=Undibacterium sp. Ji67W TaxID=3413042 RepID=UPI003BF30889
MMNTRSLKNLVKFAALCGLFLLALPASAHISVMHSVGGFQAGLLHPLTGLDHLLAMLAVGMWAAQNQRPAIWLLPLVFPLMMVAGALVGMSGVLVPGIEAGIAASVLILGLLIAFMVRLPVALSACLVAVFALAHGYAHGVELPAGTSGAWFGTGFLLSTAFLHVTGLFATLLANRIASRAVSLQLNRILGAGIALAGLYFSAALA